MEEHTIEISTNGETQITVAGVKGKKCKDITRQVESALGKTVKSQPTPEYYQQEKNRVRTGN